MKIKLPKPLGFLVFMVILFALGYLLPWTFVLGKAGLLDPVIARQLDLYSKIMLGFSIGVILIYIFNFKWKRNDKYGDNIGVYNRQETKLGKKITYYQYLLISLILFGITFLVANIRGKFEQGFFGTFLLPTQQFSPGDSLIVSFFQTPISENMMLAFTIGVIVLLITFLAIKFNWKKSDFMITKYSMVILLSGIFGYIWHRTVYSSDTLASTVVAVFWALGGLISLLSGSMIPFLVMHALNNFFIDFSRLYSSDLLVGVVISVIIACAILLYLSFQKKKEKV